MVCRPSSWSLSSWFYIILVLQLKVNRSPRTGMTQGQHLHLLKLISMILTQTCCLFTSCIPVSVSIYRNNVKRMVGWVTVPEGFISCENRGARPSSCHGSGLLGLKTFLPLGGFSRIGHPLLLFNWVFY